jgi:hypothetical protein
VIVGLGAPALAATATVEPSADATLYASDAGSVANGSGEYVFLGRNSGGNTRRALFAFDASSAVPSGAIITGAALWFSVSSTSGGPALVSLHALTSAWTEGPSDPTGSEGSGAPSQPGDATWMHASYPDVEWATPGGDFDPAPFASLVIDQPGAYEIESGAALVARVQSWVDAPGSNLGFAMLGDESSVGTAKRIDSRSAPDAGVRPVLTIEFTIPAPGTLWLGAIYAVASRRRRA